MQKPLLKATDRTALGKKEKQLRRAGSIPGVVYGTGDSASVEFEELQLKKILPQIQHRQVIIELERGGNREDVILTYIQRNPVNDALVHLNFLRVMPDRKLHLSLPLVFTGKAPALTKGGVFIYQIEEIAVSCFPRDLPEAIEVDLSPLVDFDQALLLKDITLPEGVECLIDPSTLIVKAVEPSLIAEPTETEIKGEGEESTEPKN